MKGNKAMESLGFNTVTLYKNYNIKCNYNLAWLLNSWKGGWSSCWYSTTDQGELLNKIKYEKIYFDADKDKLDILKDNKGKSGIYLWENKENGKFYIGSSIDLKRRLMLYYNINYLAKFSTSYINNALLKEGYSAFRLYIIEYCNKQDPGPPALDPDPPGPDLIKREQYYFDLLKPTYNICKMAGSSLGRLHTKASKIKMANAKLSKTLPSEVKEKISATMVGRNLTKEHKSKLSLNKFSKKILVLNLQTNEESIFNSYSQAEKALGFPKYGIGLNLRSKSGAPYRGIYKFTLLDGKG